MASNNHQPKGDPASHTAKSPPSRRLKTLLMISGFIILILALVLSMVFYYPVFHPPTPIPPSFTLTSLSANPLSNLTMETTWNLTLSISNPNPKYDIYFNHSMLIIFFYNGYDHLPVDIGFAELGQLVPMRKSQMLLSQNVVFPKEKFGKNDMVIKNIVDYQKNGSSVRVVDISGFIYMKYKKEEKDWKMYGFYCKGLNVVFDQKPSNKSALGFVSDLPKQFDFTFTGTLLSPF